MAEFASLPVSRRGHSVVPALRSFESARFRVCTRHARSRGMTHNRSFRDSNVWRHAMVLVEDIYRLSAPGASRVAEVGRMLNGLTEALRVYRSGY